MTRLWFGSKHILNRLNYSDVNQPKYCKSKKSWYILCCKLLNETGKDYLDRQYTFRMCMLYAETTRSISILYRTVTKLRISKVSNMHCYSLNLSILSISITLSLSNNTKLDSVKSINILNLGECAVFDIY